MRVARPRWPSPLLAAVALAAAAAGCGDDAPADADGGAPDGGDVDVCAIAAGEAVNLDLAGPMCRWLSSYRLFTDGEGQVPNAGVVPYDLNTPLFSDYALKYRFIYLPDGEAMTYDEAAGFEFPVGAIIVKTFAYADDLRAPDEGRRLLETRLMIHRADGWEAASYIWNDDWSDAELEIVGGTIPSEWIDVDGEAVQNDYVVPNTNQCKSCHEEVEDVFGTLGGKARHLNRDFDHGEGPVNQLAHFSDLGMLEGAPADPADAPRLAVWNDPESGTLDERARGWLDINCAHCHSQTGAARTSGLYLGVDITNTTEFGVCKTPVAAGQASGGRQYDIVPGEPDESIVMFRLESDQPEIRMPELGRNLVHAEGAALIREWIDAMEGGCGPPPL